jgi:hypothetical protein
VGLTEDTACCADGPGLLGGAVVGDVGGDDVGATVVGDVVGATVGRG